MITRYPDNPMLVSVDFLRTLDAEEPGRWIGQPKLDGWRRTAWHTANGWIWQAKHTSGPAARELLPLLREEFEELDGHGWPRGAALDCEWMGPRMVEHTRGKQELHVFDMLQHGDQWLGSVPFVRRYQMLAEWLATRETSGVRLVPIRRNPGLVDFYLEQLQDPLSEGLVVRRADSKLIGNTRGCVDNPQWFKVKYRDVKDIRAT